MKVDEAEVERIARLAHLRFTAAERVRMSEEMSVILGYIEQLPAVDINERESVSEIQTGSRPDLVSDSLPAGAVEQNAPLTMHGFFVVPRVIAGGEK